MSKFDPFKRLHLQVFASRRLSMVRGPRTLFASGCLGVIALHAVAADAQPSPCARIAEPMARLACYDERERNEAARRVEDTAPAAPAAPAAVEPAASAAGRFASSALENRWELRPELQRGTFNLVPHRSVYGLVHWASDANEQPSTPTRSSSERVELDRAEAKIQLSFKSKVVQDLFASEGDIWIGYTQVSYWQAGNSRNSSPFRETNYEPEAMYVQPLRMNLGPLRFRMASIGLTHQSNGRTPDVRRRANRWAIAGFVSGSAPAASVSAESATSCLSKHPASSPDSGHNLSAAPFPDAPCDPGFATGLAKTERINQNALQVQRKRPSG